MNIMNVETPVENEDIFEVRTSIFNIVVPLRAGRALVYNPLTQALAVYTKGAMDIYEEATGGVIKSDHEFLDQVRNSGHFVRAEADEYRWAESLYQAERNNDKVLMLVVAPTMGCNFACDYCFQGLDKANKKMSQESRDAIVDLLDGKHADAELVSLMWYGGEPLNDKKTVLEVSERMHKKCAETGKQFALQMVSNGYQLVPSLVDKLAAFGFGWVQITIDGPPEIHDTRRILLSGKGSYDRIVENIDYILNNTEIGVCVRVNLDVRNLEHGFDLIDDLAARGFGGKRLSLDFAPVHSSTQDWVDDEGVVADKLYYAAREIELFKYAKVNGMYNFFAPPRFMSICVGVKSHAYLIGPNGDFHNCFETVHDDKFAIGHVSDLDTALATEKAARWQIWSPFVNPTCRQCKLLTSCGGACAHRFLHADETNGAATKLPCPSMKFNMAERLFELAKQTGIDVTDDDWLPHKSRTSAEMMGLPYNEQRLAEAVQVLEDRMTDHMAKEIRPDLTKAMTLLGKKFAVE
jgi:uncharacterized protein